MLLKLYSDFNSILVCELIELSETFVSDNLVLIVTEAEEYGRLAVSKARVDNLHLYKLARELDRSRTSQNCEGTLVTTGLASLN